MNLMKLTKHLQLKSNNFYSHREKDNLISIFNNKNQAKLNKMRRLENQSIRKRINYKNEFTSRNRSDRSYNKINVLYLISKESIVVKNKQEINKMNMTNYNIFSISNNNACFINKLQKTTNESDKNRLENSSKEYKAIKLSSHLNTKSFTCHKDIVSDTSICGNSHRSLILQTNYNYNHYFDHIDIKQISLTEEEKKLYGSRELKGFQRKEILGKGGWSIVWLAKDHKNKEYAMKQIAKTSEDSIKTARKEIKMLDYIISLPNKCSNIILYKYYKETSKDIWIICEKGGYALSNLSFKIQKDLMVQYEQLYSIKQGRFYHHMMIDDISQFKFFIKSMISFIQFISSHSISHFDIKPDNILISFDSRTYSIIDIKIIDFGSAFIISQPNGLISNTPEYMSPEIISLLKHSVSIREINNFLKTLVDCPYCIDIWSLGVTLLELALACPIWMSQKAKITIKNKTMIKTGLFGFKDRGLNLIHHKQCEIGNTIHRILEESVIDDIDERKKFEDLLKQMLNIDYHKRITPLQALNHSFLK